MAPPATKTALTIMGKITNHKLASKFLGSERDNVYLPPTIAGPLPVVYSAHGQVARIHT